MSFPFRHSTHSLVTVDRVSYRVFSQTRDGNVYQAIANPEIFLELSHDDFALRMRDGKILVDPEYFSPSKAKLRLRRDETYLASLTDKWRDQALWALFYCEAFHEKYAKGEVKRTDHALKAALPDLQAIVDRRMLEADRLATKTRSGRPREVRDAPSPRTLRRWLRLYDLFDADPLALVRKSNPGRIVRRVLCPAAITLMMASVRKYLSPNRPSQREIAKDTQASFRKVNEERATQGLPPLIEPSITTITRAIRGLDPFEVMAQREGMAKAQRHFGFYENGVSTLYPLERVEIDEWQVDLITLLAETGALEGMPPEEIRKLPVGRRWVYVAIDVATRCVVGMKLVAEPSAEGAVATLDMIMRDKADLALRAGCEHPWPMHGTPGSVVSDQGTAFIANLFRAALAACRITRETPPAGVPKLRGHIERLFGTLGSQFVSLCFGRTFSNSAQRGGYPSEDWAVLTDDELYAGLIRFIVDVYHHVEHSGLGGCTPAEMWDRLSSEMMVSMPPDECRRRVAFGVPLTRTLGRHGVRVNSIDYSCPELRDLYARNDAHDIDIRFDAQDLGHVAVRIGKDWCLAEAVTAAVKGVSLEEWEAAVFRLRNEYRDIALMSQSTVQRAIDDIRAMNIAAAQRKGLSIRTYTAAQIKAGEENLYIGLSIGLKNASVQPARSVEGLPGELITVPESLGSHGGAHAPQPASNSLDIDAPEESITYWTLED